MAVGVHAGAAVPGEARMGRHYPVHGRWACRLADEGRGNALAATDSPRLARLAASGEHGDE
jgi:hypothetical protein